MKDWTDDEALAFVTEVGRNNANALGDVILKISVAVDAFLDAVGIASGPVYRCSGRWVAWRDGQWVPVVRLSGGSLWLWAA